MRCSQERDDLLREYQRVKSETLLLQLIKEHTPLARLIAKRLRKKHGLHIEQEYLEAAGISDFPRMFNKYDWSTKFSTYAYNVLWGRMKTAISELDFVGKGLRRTGYDKKVFFTSQVPNEEKEVDFGFEMPEIPHLEQVEMWGVLYFILNDQQQLVFNLRYREHWSVQEIAKYFGVSPKRISQVYMEALEKLERTRIIQRYLDGENVFEGKRHRDGTHYEIPSKGYFCGTIGCDRPAYKKGRCTKCLSNAEYRRRHPERRKFLDGLTCVEDGCTEPAYCRERCTRHYQKYMAKIRESKNDKCSVPDCHEKVLCKGKCQYHYYHDKREPKEELLRHSMKGLFCIEPGCDKPAEKLFMCNHHYYKSRRVEVNKNIRNVGCKCSESSCNNDAFCKSLCKEHYEKQRYQLKKAKKTETRKPYKLKKVTIKRTNEVTV